MKIHFYGATGMETISIRFTTLDMMERWAKQIYRMRQKCDQINKADLPTSIKFKVHCSETGETLALVVWSDITYDALKTYIEAESQLFRSCSNFHLYVMENRSAAITSDEDLKIHLDGWWKTVTNGAGSHYLELWY